MTFFSADLPGRVTPWLRFGRPRLRAARWLLLASAVLLVAGSPTVGSCIPSAITLYNTGVDALGNPLLPGEVDPHYSLIASADALFPGPDALVVDPSQMPSSWVPDSPLSQWIGPRATGIADPPAPPDTNNAEGIYVYRMSFILCDYLCEAIITGRWATDNNGLDILINGISTGSTTPVDLFDFVDFTITSGFQPGLNTLDFVVYNQLYSDGTLSPTGLRVELQGTQWCVPEPSTCYLAGMGIWGLLMIRRTRKRAEGWPWPRGRDLCRPGQVP